MLSEIVEGAAAGEPIAEGADPYANLEDGQTVGSGKRFTATQRANVLEANRAANGGVLRSDRSGVNLDRASQSQRGVSPSPREAHVDHYYPRSKGGPNSYRNAQVLSREENIRKRDNW